MKTPAIVKLNGNERQELINEIKQSPLQENNKAVMIDTLEFINELVEELKTSKVSIHNLKQLLGFKSEQLKKVAQGR
jgi:hypothetical protein